MVQWDADAIFPRWINRTLVLLSIYNQDYFQGVGGRFIISQRMFLPPLWKTCPNWHEEALHRWWWCFYPQHVIIAITVRPKTKGLDPSLGCHLTLEGIIAPSDLSLCLLGRQGKTETSKKKISQWGSRALVVKRFNREIMCSLSAGEKPTRCKVDREINLPPFLFSHISLHARDEKKE